MPSEKKIVQTEINPQKSEVESSPQRVAKESQETHSEQIEKKGSLVGFLVQFFLIALVFFAIGFVVGQKKIEIDKRGKVPIVNVSSQTSPEIQNVDFSLFWEVFKILPEKFIDKNAVSAQEMVYGAISGMVRSLGDPYTAFVNPKQNELIKSELAGAYEGVGIQIGFNEDKRLAVIAPLSGTPAEREGIFAKDIIAKIDKRDTFDLTLPEAVELIRGPAGTKVKLTLIREGEAEPIEKEVERANIDVKSVEVELSPQREAQEPQETNSEQIEKKGSLVGFLVQFFLVALVFFAIGFVVGQKKIEIDKRGKVPIVNVSIHTSP